MTRRIRRRTTHPRNVVAYLVPVKGCVPALWTPRIVRVREGAPELEKALTLMGAKVSRFVKVGEADAWLDDQRLCCSCCSDGRGDYRCASCQEGILIGQLERSVEQRGAA